MYMGNKRRAPCAADSARPIRATSTEVAAPYRVAFLDPAGGVFDAIQFKCGSDEMAIEEAHRLNVPSMGAGFDVWHEDRVVHRHRRETAEKKKAAGALKP
jgi:hypothetical protein